MVLLCLVAGSAAEQNLYVEAPLTTSADYYWIKNQLKQSFDKHYPGLQLVPVETFSLPNFIFDWQVSEDWVARSQGGVTRDDLLTEIAVRVTVWKRVLPLLGYPRSVWSDDLRNYENQAVEAVLARPPAAEVVWACFSRSFPHDRRWFDQQLPSPSDVRFPPSERDEARFQARDLCEENDPLTLAIAGTMMKPLLAKLASYRRSQPRTKTVPIEIESSGIGGATPQTREIFWEPTSGKLRMIPLHYYMLCERRKLNAEDPQRCAQWLDVLGTTVEGIGVYRFFARWPDGATRSGQVEIKDGDTARRWVLKP